MGRDWSCGEREESGLFSAVQNGEVELVEAMVEADPSVLEETGGYGRFSALHVAAADGRTEVISVLLDRSVNPDILNRNRQILIFDSQHGRTCLHYAAYYGHSDCLQAILSAAHSTPVADSWEFARFVNIRDGEGATPLHLAARQSRPESVHILLDSGAFVCASTGGNGYLGSTPLHLAAHGGSLECVCELLAWGADRLQVDSSGRIPYTIALKHKHRACAALLNPSSAEPIIWPSPLKFISELNPEAKALLERALKEARGRRPY